MRVGSGLQTDATTPNNGRAVQTDPTLLRYASAITEQKKCWELLAEKFDWLQTLLNNTQQSPTTCNRVCKRTQHVTSNNVGSCWPTMLRPFARGFNSQRLDSSGFMNEVSLACFPGINAFISVSVSVGISNIWKKLRKRS